IEQDKKVAEKTLQVAEANLEATKLKLDRDKEIAEKTLQVAEANLRAAEAKQVSEQFIKATECVSSKDVLIRVAGVYSLERIGKRSDDDFRLVIEVLTALVRQSLPSPVDRLSDEKIEEMAKLPYKSLPSTTPQDVKAVVDVVGRRGAYQKTPRNLGWIVLSHTDFSRVSFSGGNNSRKWQFHWLDFSRAVLIQAYAQEIDFIEGSFWNADLRLSAFIKCVFTNYGFKKADLRHARFRDSKFPMSDFDDARMEKADFQGADLSRARGLTQKQVDSAIINSDTKLPPNLVNKYTTGKTLAPPV
ncbi:MAG: pentapeptide repeat-containing protein, partial [Proteobacteria bacterium]